MARLAASPKGYTADQDKIRPPRETVAAAKAAFARFGTDVLAETRRIDTGRLGIPVFMSLCGQKARAVMPTRKQMGKGASPEQAEASALMELAERFSFFSFWETPANFFTATWSEAEARFGERLLPLSLMQASVGEILPEATARAILDLLPWRFAWARNVATGEQTAVPVDWFKALNEFNGASAGNDFAESVLQGTCELVERHVCARIDRDRPTLPDIDPATCTDPVLTELLAAFAKNGVRVRLKDFSLGLPVPTVAALAYDPATFPDHSEIVFTAGTAASPTKAAIRALTEVAQLAGDFETKSNYEASGLPKWTALEQTAWLTAGPTVALADLPDLSRNDMAEELTRLATALADLGSPVFTVDTTHPTLRLPANYTMVPGFAFRERTPAASLGLFTGRALAERADPARAASGLARLADLLPGAPYLPFFKGLLALRLDDAEAAVPWFVRAESVQPRTEDKALAAFYQAFALSRLARWTAVEPPLDRAIAAAPDVTEYRNLRGVARFKAGRFALAADDFTAALAINAGSAMDLANLGLCELHLGRTDLAARDLSAALSLDAGLDFAREQLEKLLSPEHRENI